MSIKLIAVDIDGTLVNSQKEITPEVFSAIQDAKQAGVKVVIATGRPIAGVAKLLDDLQLRDQGDYVVTFNGALVQETATGHEIISESLTYEDYLDMEFLSRKLGVHMHAITKDGIYTANRNIGKYTVSVLVGFSSDGREMSVNAAVLFPSFSRLPAANSQ